MPQLLADAYHSLEADLERGIVRINRSAQAFASGVELERAFARLHNAMTPIDRPRSKLLVDIRAVGGRNDPEFEQAFAPHRTRMRLPVKLLFTIAGWLVGCAVVLWILLPPPKEDE